MAYGIITPTKRTPFSKVLPFDKVFDPTLVGQLAEENINPEINRQSTQSMRDLNSNLAQTGAFRTGLAASRRGNLSDAYERLRKQQVQGFISAIKNPLTDWYNKQERNYYENPTGWKMPTLPTYNEYIQQNPQLSNLLQGNSVYQDPFNF